MQLLLYLAGAIGFLFLALLANSYTSTNSLFAYLSYMCILPVFYFLGSAIKFYTEWNRETNVSRRIGNKKRQDDYKQNLRKRLGR